MKTVINLPDSNQTFELDELRRTNNPSNIDIVFRNTKSNLMEINGQVCKPRHLEIWKKSGNCFLWVSFPKGKSFSQNSFSFEVTLKAVQ